MLAIVVLFFVLSGANLEMQFQHTIYTSRKPRTVTYPINTVSVHNTFSAEPGRITTFENTYDKPTEKYVKIKGELDTGKNNGTDSNNTSDYRDMKTKRMEDKGTYLSSKQNEEYAKAKIKRIQAPEDLNTTTGISSDFNVYNGKEMFTPYVADKEFKVDDEDVRTDSRNNYNGWPYSYNGPYDYQMKKLNTKNEKAKDKRFLGSGTTIIPVHENVVENIPVGYIPNIAPPKEPIIDNPVYGDQPFFSFVLNDYFDKHHEEDPLIFKDFPWSDEYDSGVSTQDIDDSEKRSRRLYEINNPIEIQNCDIPQRYLKNVKVAVTEKASNWSPEYEKYQRGNDDKDHQASMQNYEGQRTTAFKDFADSFANKFGLEKHNKNSKFSQTTNQDRGEKKKGFKRVYHKDEYGEDSEFYDNTDKSYQSEEHGDSHLNVGGLQSFKQSQAIGAAGGENNSLKSNDHKQDKHFGNSDEANERHKDHDGEINHYRNIAKDAALSNNADYVDHFRM